MYSIILVTFNRLSHLKHVVEAISHQTVSPAKIVIVDNHSMDGTQEYLENIKINIPVHLLRTEANVGHGAALARGMRWMIDQDDSPFIILLEDDSIPKPTLAEAMMRYIQDFNYEIVCLDGFKFSLGKRFRPELVDNKIVNVDFGLLDGAILKLGLIKRVGVPKEDFFMMCDDLEYSKRMTKHGVKIGCVKSGLHDILHMGGGTRFSKATLWRGYYQARNGIHVLKVYFSLWSLADFVLLEAKRIAGCLMAPDRFFRIYLRLLGLTNGLLGKKGKTLDPANF